MTQISNQKAISFPFKLLTKKDPEFLVIAHRGASAFFPENTMSAFRAAAKMGVLMIELDIALSKDGIPVVIHDEKLNRTTNGKGRVSDFTLSELKKLDAGSWFGFEFKSEKIPTLEEVLSCAQNKVALNIEIKPEAVGSSPKGGIEELSLELVKKFGMEEHVFFSSFNYRAAEHLRKLDDQIPTAILYEKKQAAGRSPSQQVADSGANAFNCNYKFISKNWMQDLDKHKIPVFAYTVNTEKEKKRLKEMGVKGIFSDFPDL